MTWIPPGLGHEPSSGPRATALRSGDLVRVRGQTWRVTSIRAGGACTALELLAQREGRGRAVRVVLLPFDRPVAIPASERPRVGSRRRWCSHVRTALADQATGGLAAALCQADVDWLPYQLEPLLALLGGRSHRVLIADHVGLGKTIEAGLVLLALRSRTPDARVLCLVPAGLRAQWHRELGRRFAIEALDCDAAWLTRRLAELPPGANPWSLPGVYLVSHDYVKRAEILSGLDATGWDALVVDEAHTAAAPSDRSEAVAGLARRALRVVLLSATPHDGDPARFTRLCSLGRLGDDDRLAVFRRTRKTLGLDTDHRCCVLPVAASAEERHVHGLLARYRDAVERDTGSSARLAMLVLWKRALSGPFALCRSLSRRLELLGSAAGSTAQLALPLGDACGDDGDDLPDAALAVPGLSNAVRERLWLNALAHAARAAVPRDRKLAALSRFVRRTREPLVVFTEYRDTLLHVARHLSRLTAVAVLHGGQTPQERAAALGAFDRGEARLLVATDVASHGLNLQHTCRAVATLELPWNPNRLEQRVGRVHRLGQLRRCHAVHLVGRDTAEAHVAGRLGLLAGRIRHALGDCGSHLDDIEKAFAPAAAPTEARVDTAGDGMLHVDLGRDAQRLVNILQDLRRRPSRRRPSLRARRSEAPVAALALARHSHESAAGLPPGVICLHRHLLSTGTGRVVETALSVVHLDVALPRWRGRPGAGDVRRFIDEVLGRARPRLERAVADEAQRLLASARARWAQLAASDGRRLDLIRKEQRHRLARHFAQPGLFDDLPGPAPRASSAVPAVVWPAVAVTPVSCSSRLHAVLVWQRRGQALAERS